jgi:hypothetical protein
LKRRSQKKEPYIQPLPKKLPNARGIRRGNFKGKGTVLPHQVDKKGEIAGYC